MSPEPQSPWELASILRPNRRRFLKSSALTAAGLAFLRWPVMAGPFTRADFDQLVPADKKLRPEWVKSLFARGERTVYRGADLANIGMPIGGICAGQLYLGGDGKLWHWDIFNHPTATDAGHYASPMKPSAPLEQGFALRVTDAGTTRDWALDRAHWREVSFTGEYPIGYVEYRDPDSPASVRLEAFSPFIPLNTDDSSLPATVLEFTVRNERGADIEVELAGWLENAVCLHSGHARAGLRRNRLVRHEGLLFLECSAEEAPASDRPRAPLGPLAAQEDFGTMGLGLLESEVQGMTFKFEDPGFGQASVPEGSDLGRFFPRPTTPPKDGAPVSRPFDEKLIGSLTRKMRLAPGASATATFVLTWHMPNLKLNRLPGGRYYSTRFASALAVAQYVQEHFSRLSSQTRLWHDTWYDSTLPYWFLDRTFLNTSILATSTCHRFANGRFYGWEGVGCCEGTCGHVWHYAHAVARVFPELERITREKVDLGLALQPDGAIHFRGECNDIPAIDAQAGVILRVLREHQMSPDDAFLKRNWPRLKQAVEWLIAKDGNGDGLIEGNQHNTLDTDWYGPVAWLSGLYLAALLAARHLALELGDSQFADRCRLIFETGQKNLVARLFQDGYFVNQPDPKHLDAINSGAGCEIDQVFGQSWAFQVGLPRVLPEAETVAALKSLWRYNFTPDVGPYRQVYKPGRWYAMPGEAGLLMCTFPRSGWDYAQAKGKGPDWAAGYFNECMNGFEYQVAGHMLWEGMLTEGLAVTRAVHDRYHPSRRNPWNEVECGDHYARSMASYGVFIAACGFEYHGPKQHIGFAPRLTPDNFKAPFTSAEGWGTFAQQQEAGSLKAEVRLRWGKLKLRALSLEMAPGPARSASVVLGAKPVPVTVSREGRRVVLTFGQAIEIAAGNSLTIHVS